MEQDLITKDQSIPPGFKPLQESRGPAEPGKTRNTFSTLDGMRGIAAIFVLLLHTGAYWGGITFHRSYLAVDLFFLLSGFVIAHAYEKKLEQKKITSNNFITIRLVRLYPMYLISVLIAAAVLAVRYFYAPHDAPIKLPYLIESIILTVCCLPSVWPGSVFLFPINSAYWSIFYELLINILYVCIRTWLTNRVLLALISILGFAMFMIAVLHGSLGAGVTWNLTSIAAGITRSAFGIFFGIYLYRTGKEFLVKHIVPAWLLLGLMSAILMTPRLGGLNGAFDLLAVFVVFPYCVVFGARCKCSALTDSVFGILGRSSYPVYLIHAPLASLGEFLLGNWVTAYAPYSGVLLVVSLIFISIQLENNFDIPFRQYLSDRFVKKTTAPNLQSIKA